MLTGASRHGKEMSQMYFKTVYKCHCRIADLSLTHKILSSGFGMKYPQCVGLLIGYPFLLACSQ